VQAPKTEAEQAALGNAHLKWVQDPDLPGGFGHVVPDTYQESGATGANKGVNPPPPGQTSQGVKPPPAAGATPPAMDQGRQPLVPPPPVHSGPPRNSDELRQRQAEAKVYESLLKEQGTSLLEFRTNANAVRQWLNDPEWEKARMNALPSGKGNPLIVGGKMLANAPAMAVKGWSGDPSAKFLQQAPTNIIPSIRALSVGTKGNRITQQEINLLASDWEKLQRGTITQEEAAQFKRLYLKKLDDIEGALQYATPEATTNTPTSTPTPSSAAPATPAAPLTVNDVLKKHNY
jgi:hypothetical protein